MREFFLREFLARESEFSFVEQQQERGGHSTFHLEEMAASGLRDQDRLDGASNYVIWKARISCFLDEHFLKVYIDNVVAKPTDPNQLKKYKVEIAKTKRMILDRVKDHIVCHIAGRNTAKEMWDALSTFYQGSSEQRKMYLEQKMRST